MSEELAVHYGAGRLSTEEFDARVTAAIRAETLAELRHLTCDLPAPSPASSPAAPVPAADRRNGWQPLDALALMVALGCLAVGVVALMGLNLLGNATLTAAGFVGGCVAALGGASAAYLLQRAISPASDRRT